MAVLDSKKVLTNLKKKGFIDSKNHSPDHKYLEYFLNGKYILYTKVSHGGKEDLRDHLIKQMAEQCKISKDQFLDLVNCPLNKDQYARLLKENLELI